MIKSILSFLDFAEGSKTHVMSVFTVVALISASVGISVEASTLNEIFFEVIKQTEVILGAAGVLYGLLMKVCRIFVR